MWYYYPAIQANNGTGVFAGITDVLEAYSQESQNLYACAPGDVLEEPITVLFDFYRLC
jgi:hypothetical protein